MTMKPSSYNGPFPLPCLGDWVSLDTESGRGRKIDNAFQCHEQRAGPVPRRCDPAPSPSNIVNGSCSCDPSVCRVNSRPKCDVSASDVVVWAVAFESENFWFLMAVSSS